jgi:hypothetical protein
VGTRMAGMIPYIQIEEASDLGKAIASLTGLRPLEHLVKHAEKTQEKLKGQLRKEYESKTNGLDNKFAEIYKQLIELINTTPSLPIKIDTIANNKDKSTNNKLKKVKSDFERIETKELERAKDILGKDFNPDDAQIRKDLTDNVSKALGLIEPGNLSLLPSLQRLNNLKKLMDEDITEARAITKNILNQAKIIEELEKKPDHASRERLYANIGKWIRQNNKSTTICPVCDKDIRNQNDKVTGKKITEHIEEHIKEDKEYLSKEIQEWDKNWIEKLFSKLPGCLPSEIKTDLPSKPADLISTALGEELFGNDVFKQSLSPLQHTTQDLCRAVLAEIDTFDEPSALFFSDYFTHNCQDLKVTLNKLNRAVAFAEWRKNNDKGCKNAYGKIVGNASIEEVKEDIIKHSLYFNLSSLNQLVKNTTPIRESLLKIEELRRIMTERRKAELFLKHCEKTAKAIDDIKQINILVELQVGSLIQKLSSDIKAWKEKFYSPAYKGVPEIADTDIGPNGSIIIDAEVGGTKASSKHICNSSDLRATLLAVIVSFWKYLMTERGCLSLIVLDDLQELFDKANRRKIANSIKEIIGYGGRILITTNDSVFGKQIVKSNTLESIDRRRIHPIKTCRPHIELGVYNEDIDVKRAEFRKPENVNMHQPARDYINALRLYLEYELQDFFDEICPSLPRELTLRDLLNGIRRWRTSGQEPFVGQAFQNLLDEPALRDGSKFMELMNKSHHGNADEIKYTDVLDNESNCCKVMHLIECAHEEYERWLRRDPLPQVTVKPDIPKSTLKLEFSIPVYENLAAATPDSGISEIEGSKDVFSTERLGDYAIYVVNSDSLGFSVPRYSRVIVRLNEEPVEDNSLVIALHKDRIYARRFLQQYDNPEVVALSSEDANPIKRAPSLVLPVAEVRLLEIVGVILDDNPSWEKRSGEATLINDYELPYKPTIAFTIRGDSALPLALPGQLVIGAERLLSNKLDEHEGNLAAIAFSGQEAFKRIGKRLPSQPRLRVFESIGGLGESILIRTDEVENDPFSKIPLIDTVYRIAGIIYVNSLF